MKTILLMALVATFSAAVNAQGCKTVDNCDTCSNPGAECLECPKTGTIMSSDKKSCLACGTGCDMCTADTSNKVTCTMCAKGYYLKAGACTVCDTGCAECSLASDGTTVNCDKCVAEAWAAATDAKGKTTCTACPSKCKTCTVQTDGTTKCSTCYDYKGKTKQGYFLKASDKSCGTCPSFCESCSDDGNGVGLCKSCFAGYNALEDPNDSTKDKTECLSCHTDCKTCSGVKIGSVATCTECVADKGLYINNGACAICKVGAKTCADTGDATDCKIKYRLDTPSCSTCPAFCDECPKDSNGVVSDCAACEANYGNKPTSSKTCDYCGVSNCNACTRSNSGVFSCSACNLGFALVSSTSCGSCPSSCSATNGCTYSSSAYKCLTGCKDSTYTNAPSGSGVCSLCTTADSACSACQWSGSTVQCSACTLPKLLNGTDYTCVANTDSGNNCKVGNADASACTTCKDGYSEVAADGISCVQCTDSANCITCNATYAAGCKTCKVGYVSDDPTLGGTCVQCSDNSWGTAPATGISNCDECAWSGSSVICSKCKTGYLKSSDNLNCVANVDTLNTQCKSLAGGSTVNCGQCNNGYGPVTTNTNCPKCNDGNCMTCVAETSGQKKCTTCNAAFITTDNAGGECKACPSQCTTCTWDSANSKTVCTAGNCASKYARNQDTGTCDACPDNCDTCEWDSTNKIVICSINSCKTKFGRLTSDKTKCNACPGNCDTCSVSSAAGADDTLFCDTCTGGNALNADVCAACPSNCKICTDNKGTMECSTCKDKYALDGSTKSCVKCPTNCLKCSTNAGTTKCADCAVGYSLSIDSTSCTDCSDAAFANCAKCTGTDSASGKANCTDCTSGYALEDDDQTKSCTDLGNLACGNGEAGDAPPQCSACSTGFSVTKEMLCAKKCYSCGDISDAKYVDKAKCTIPAAGVNATENDAELEDCLNGICYAVTVNGKVAAGCLPSNDITGTCTGDRAAGETCKTANGMTVCGQCCTKEKCNTFVSTLDGVPDSATAASINFLMLCVAALVAIRMY